MEKISDFFKEFKNRITNPLIFSFIVSWIIINWKVVVGFVMYNSKSLPQLNYINYYDLINDNCSTGNYLWKPLQFAIAYTFLFPPIRLIIISFLTLFKKWSNNLSLYIMKDANLPMSRLIKETERTNKLASELEELIKKDKVTKVENEKLKLEKADLEKELTNSKVQESELGTLNSQLQSQYETLTTFTKNLTKQNKKYSIQADLRHIEGTWQLTEIDSRQSPNKQTDRTITIVDSKIFYMESTTQEKHVYDILGFYYEIDNEKVILTLQTINPNRELRHPSISVQTLEVKSHYNGHIGEMIGTSSSGYDVGYRLIKGNKIEELM